MGFLFVFVPILSSPFSMSQLPMHYVSLCGYKRIAPQGAVETEIRTMMVPPNARIVVPLAKGLYWDHV